MLRPWRGHRPSPPLLAPSPTHPKRGHQAACPGPSQDQRAPSGGPGGEVQVLVEGSFRWGCGAWDPLGAAEPWPRNPGPSPAGQGQWGQRENVE